MSSVKAVSASEPRPSDGYVLVSFEVVFENSDGSCSRKAVSTWMAPRDDGKFLAVCEGFPISRSCPQPLNLWYTSVRGARWCPACWRKRNQ
jgi:hypothetical protein